jgi:hypothetical protein
MSARLSSTDVTIMAGLAIVSDTWVIKRRTSKVRGVEMASVAIKQGISLYVIWQFTQADYVVVARVAASHKRSAGMIKAAGDKGARAVANTTIFSGLQVVERFAAGINTMTGRAIVHDVAMIDERTSETISVMARSTIGTGCRVGRHRRGFSGRVNTIAIIVTWFTWLYCWINQAVVENTTEAESLNTMAGSTIDARDRMTWSWISCLVSCGNPMAGITTIADNSRVGVVGIGRQKTDSGMTVTAFSVGNDMVFVHTCGYTTGVATGTYIRRSRMIKASVRFQVQKMDGIVAAIAFGFCWLMKLRFTDGQYTVMAFAAVSKNFLVIDKGGIGKSQGGMAGLARITGGDVIRQFRWNQFTVWLTVHAIMTFHAIWR